MQNGTDKRNRKHGLGEEPRERQIPQGALQKRLHSHERSGTGRATGRGSERKRKYEYIRKEGHSGPHSDREVKKNEERSAQGERQLGAFFLCRKSENALQSRRKLTRKQHGKKSFYEETARKT